MTLAKDTIVAALQLRYDYYSAETMFESARTRAGLPEQPAYDAAEITAFRAALARVGDRLGAVEARLDQLLGTNPVGSAPLATFAERAEDAASTAASPVVSEAAPAALVMAAAPLATELSSTLAAGAQGAPDAARASSTASIAAITSRKVDERPEPAAKSRRGKAAAEASLRPTATSQSAAEAGERSAAPSPGAEAGERSAAPSPGAEAGERSAAPSPGAEAGERSAAPSPNVEVGSASEAMIVLTGVELDDGEHVLVCGGHAELGDWDPARACRMRREGDRYVAIIQIGPGTEAAFKFVRCTRDGRAMWESGADRRLVAGPPIVAKWH